MTLYSKGKKIKGNKNQQEIFYESTQKLFRLLAHHPYFLKVANEIRRKHKLSWEEIDTVSKLLIWKKDHRSKYNLFLKDPKLKSLLDEFKVPSELKRATAGFFEDFILTKNLILPSMYETGLNIVRFSKNNKTIVLNPESVYLEITPLTTMREVRDNWDKITLGRKEVHNFGIPKTSEQEEAIWDLFEESYKTNEVVDLINKRFKTRYIYSDINLAKHNYKKALLRLRKLD